MIFRTTLTFSILFLSLNACSSFGKGPKAEDEESAKMSAADTSLGPKLTNYGLGVTLKFTCGKEEDAEPFKVRAYKYKLRVLENNKEHTVAGTQTRWLDTNVSEIKLKFKKGRKIQFKNVEISTDKWIRAFPESQLKSPIALTRQECKDLGSY